MAQREATFGDDLAVSWAAWQQQPALPMLTVVIAVAASFQEIVGPVGRVRLPLLEPDEEAELDPPEPDPDVDGARVAWNAPMSTGPGKRGTPR